MHDESHQAEVFHPIVCRTPADLLKLKVILKIKNKQLCCEVEAGAKCEGIILEQSILFVH